MRANPGLRIRPVSADQSQPEQSFADAARAITERALASGATILMVAWEDPSGGIVCETVPGAATLARGFAMAVAEKYLPDDSGAE